MIGEVTRKTLKILIAGVPFGRDNVGDEAILECIVLITRTVSPDAEIWVSTDDQDATEKKLNVRTVPLYGFPPRGFEHDEMFKVIDAMDVFLWAGATGLSDYPEIPLTFLQYATKREKKTVIFCVGMNTELNPYLYRLRPGAPRSIFSLVRKMSLGLIDLLGWYEARKRQRAAVLMRKGVESAGLVILRDVQSYDAMRSLIGESGLSVLIGSDPAIEILPKPIESSEFSVDVNTFCRERDCKIGLCLSAQSPVQQLSEMAALFDRIIVKYGASIVGIPMDPITDTRLMQEFREKLEHPEAMCVAEGRFEPDEIAGLASEMDLVISSRLHLLILASITLTPIIGISRGSKITNFTSQFQLPEIGSVEALDLDLLENEILRLFEQRLEFEKVASEVRVEMLKRLEQAKFSLSGFFASPKSTR